MRHSRSRSRFRSTLGAACLALASLTAGCGDGLNALEALEVTDIVTGWYDVGVVDGKNKIVPTISFRLRNTADRPITSIQVNAVFRIVGDQEELGSSFIRAIDSAGLTAGATTESFVLRSNLGYQSEASRAEMLGHSLFQDAQVELFVKHGSEQWAKIGEHPVQRQLLTQ